MRPCRQREHEAHDDLLPAPGVKEEHIEQAERKLTEVPARHDMAFRPIGRVLHLLRQVYVLSGIFVVTFALYPWLATCFMLRNHRGQQLVPQVFHRTMSRLLGLNVLVRSSPSSLRPLFLASNHTSWLDIIVITSFLPVVFVAKQEVSNWPFFGWLAQLQRSIFVNREKKQEVHKPIGLIADALLSGEVVTLFPEGTSTDGTDVSPFRSALVGAVHETLRRATDLPAVTIQPLAITYIGASGKLAVWAREDEIAFFPHLLQVAALRQIDVLLTWGEPITADTKSDRKELTRQLEGAVRRLVLEANASNASARS
jgi:1-acyl-sn-glycerol-3-phosphate acyltransferase